MDDLIRRQDALDEVEYELDTIDHVPVWVFDRLRRVIKRIHPADVAEVKHGKWIDRYNDGDWHCSICGAIVEKEEQTYRNWYWCYHCGAKMDKEGGAE